MSRAGGKDRGLFERPKGSGVWWIRYADAKGKERREKAGSKSQAQKLYSKRQAEKLQGVKLPELNRRQAEDKASSTIGEMIELYRPKFEAKASAADDIRYARYWIEAHGTTPMDELTASDVENWRNTRLNEAPIFGGKTIRQSKTRKKRTPATVNRAVAFLKRMYNLAARDLASPEFKGLRVRDGYRSYNPAAQVEQLKENNERVRFLSESEEERLRANLSAEAFRLVEVAFLTGMRMGEQFGLRRDSVDLKTGTLTIPKSKDGEKRHVHLGPRGKALFKELLAEHDSDWVFPSTSDPARHRSAEGFRNVFLAGVRAAKIRDFHWHDLRHTFASRLAMAGVELHVIRDLMGHGSIAMTERYAHLCPSRLKAAVAGL